MPSKEIHGKHEEPLRKKHTEARKGVGKVWRYVERHGEMWRGTKRYGEVWSMDRCGEE
tara:strand:- start:21 stop:194 length:174 start_codon:yes stop_codon:yes gene_type:complete